MALVPHCLLCGRRDPYGSKQQFCLMRGKCQYLDGSDKDADKQAVEFFSKSN